MLESILSRPGANALNPAHGRGGAWLQVRGQHQRMATWSNGAADSMMPERRCDPGAGTGLGAQGTAVDPAGPDFVGDRRTDTHLGASAKSSAKPGYSWGFRGRKI